MLNPLAIISTVADRLRGSAPHAATTQRGGLLTPSRSQRSGAPFALQANGAGVASGAVAWRAVVLEASAMWLASRIAMLALTYVALLMTTSGYDTGYLAHSPGEFVALWNRWDAHWYALIAQRGYWEEQATAFFPLFPLLIRLVTLVIGPHYTLAALLAGNLGTLGAFIGVGLLAAGERREAASGARAVRMLAVYPLAFFLTAPYTEGLFLAGAALTLFFARQGLWRWAALSAFLAALTRPTGAILVPPLIWELGRQYGWWAGLAKAGADGWRARSVAPLVAAARERLGGARAWLRWRAWPQALRNRTLVDGALAVVSVPAALGIFAVICRVRFHHFLIFFHAQQIYWHRFNAPIWRTLAATIDQLLILPPLSFWQMRLLVDLAPPLIVAVVTLLTIRRAPVAFTLYSLGLLYITLLSPVTARLEPDPIFSAGRFMLEAAPLFLTLGHWTSKRPSLDLLLVTCGVTLQALLGAFFLTGGWLV